MFISDFTTQRIRAKMQELTLRQAIDLCEIPETMNELGISRALNAIIAETNLPLDEWTVQERLAAICHYITAQEKGDWRVANGAMLSDYLVAQDYPDTSYIIDDDLEIVPLTAPYAEAMERAVQDKGRGDWIVAAMAATIRQRDEEVWQGSPDEFVQENMERLFGLPESEFAYLLPHFLTAQKHLAHGFELTFTGNGIAVLPQKGGTDLPSVQFRFIKIIAETTRTIWQKPDNFGADDYDTPQS